MKKCKVCNASFKAKSYQQIYCTTECRKEHHRIKQIKEIAKSGSLSKQIECIECGSKFMRFSSRTVCCSDKCKDIRKTRQRKLIQQKDKLTVKYLSARKSYTGICTICNIEYNARNYNQKCCSSECRKKYDNTFRKNWNINERKNNYNYRISCNLRSRVSRAIRRGLKAGSAIKDLGCTIEELKTHLESKFTNGMNWDNYGEWHIDHIKPLSKFDLSLESEFKEATHYTNLQPLWAKDNISKGAKYVSE